MNYLCEPCHAALARLGRDVELYGSRPISTGPCTVCGASTKDRIVPWARWEDAAYYPTRVRCYDGKPCVLGHCTEPCIHVPTECISTFNWSKP